MVDYLSIWGHRREDLIILRPQSEKFDNSISYERPYSYKFTTLGGLYYKK